MPILSWGNSHPKDVADMLIVVSEGKEDGEHEEVAADDDVSFVTLWINLNYYSW